MQMTDQNTDSLFRISIQAWLHRNFPTVEGNQDYHKLMQQMDGFAQILRDTDMEKCVIKVALEGHAGLPARQKARLAQRALMSFRMEICRNLLGCPSYRKFSTRLAGDLLLGQFCLTHQFDKIKCTSKSTLDRMQKFFTEEQLRALNNHLNKIATDPVQSMRAGLQEHISMDVCLVDSTCLETPIHFPVDWLLLKDTSITLLKAIKLIRRENLLCRMPMEVEKFVTAMNHLCISMPRHRKVKDAARKAKKIFREMKSLLIQIGKHAERHRELLMERYGNTRFSENQMQRIADRMEEKIKDIPLVIKQAHERIIGGRGVPNKEKILSVHQKQTQVIVRGKAGKQVEFGNEVFLAENAEGYLIDYQYYSQAAPAASQQAIESLQRIKVWRKNSPVVTMMVTDRGFDAEKLRKTLKEENITDCVLPRSPKKMKERMQEKTYRQQQKRRASTEARIAIWKHFGGRQRCLAKGTKHRSLAVGWGVLTHNLWWISRRAMELKERQRAERSRLAA